MDELTPTRAFDAVLFDWCGTLVGYPNTAQRLEPVLEALGRSSSQTDLDRLAAAIDKASHEPAAIEADKRCDLSAADHARTKAVIFELAGLDTELSVALEATYGDLATYDPYPEVVEVISSLHDAGVEIVIVSDFHVDLRPHFRELGLVDQIAGVVLSCEVGAIKPDPRMFEAALSMVQAPAHRCLMVGDNPHPDCGAASLGISTLILPVAARAEHPRQLDRVLDLVLR